MSGQGRQTWVLRAALIVLLTSGCSRRYLVQTPNLLHDQDPKVAYAACPDIFRKPEMEILYATDRADVAGKTTLTYGSGRSSRLAFGVARVNVGNVTTWNEFAHDSMMPTRRNEYPLQLAECKEVGQFDLLANGLGNITSTIKLVSGSKSMPVRQEAALHTMLRDRLAKTSFKDVYIFVHGFNNSFDDAVFRAGEVWHFMGRVGVPLAYTWPAGHNGLLGYAYDRESGEFTVTHFKQFLRSVAACSEVERVHVIAHSRGTDVAISALRELHIAFQAQSRNTRQELKLENLVLAAPDLDEDVFVQRFVAEEMLGAAGRTTIYASRNDRALEAADWIFGSRKRIGILGPRDFSPRVRQALARMPQLQFIECRTTGWSLNHDYVFANPGALSDLILVLRERRAPGAANGRPLLQPVEGVWELTERYPERPVQQSGK